MSIENTEIKRCTKDINNKKKQFIVMVYDRSGSTSNMTEAMISGFNNYINDRIDDKQDKTFNILQTFLYLITFDDKSDHIFKWEEIDKLKTKLSNDKVQTWFKARGSTKLNDTIMEGINILLNKIKLELTCLGLIDVDNKKCLKDILNDNIELTEKIKKIIKKSYVISLQISTDGYENASIRYVGNDGYTSICKTIEFLKKIGIDIVYIGANQDAVLTAQKYGIEKEASLTYTTNKSATLSAYDAMSNRLRRTTLDNTLPPAFTQLERHSSIDTSIETQNIKVPYNGIWPLGHGVMNKETTEKYLRNSDTGIWIIRNGTNNSALQSDHVISVVNLDKTISHLQLPITITNDLLAMEYIIEKQKEDDLNYKWQNFFLPPTKDSNIRLSPTERDRIKLIYPPIQMPSLELPPLVHNYTSI